MNPDAEQPEGQTEAAALPLEQFRAELDVFSGPLDLLLHLIRRDEINVLEIPVARITDQYLRMIKAMGLLDVNTAADFLVMAATLMDIKSRTLLPEYHPEEEEQEDARDELVRQLLQYKRFKGASQLLLQRSHDRRKRFGRPALVLEPEPRVASVERLLEDVSVWDLLSAYAEMVRQVQMTQPRNIVYDDVPVRVYMEEVVRALSDRGGRMVFLDCFELDRSRGRVIGIFLAVLDLVRRGRISVEQAQEDSSRIEIELTEPGDDDADRAAPPGVAQDS